MFGKFKDFLWPLGATILAMFVVPIAIEQYPEVFKDSPWILPLSVLAVCLCWIVPLLVHHRVRRIHDWMFGNLGRGWGWIAVIVIWIVAVATLVVFGYKLYGKHAKHLHARLQTREMISTAPPQGKQATSGKTGAEKEPASIEPINPPISQKPKHNREPGLHGKDTATHPTELDPSLVLLRDAEKMALNLKSLNETFMLNLHALRPEIDEFRSRTTTGDLGVRNYTKMRTDEVEREVVDTYKQEYRSDAIKIRGQLMEECPGIANLRLNYSEPKDPMEILEMGQDLDALVGEYKNKLLAEGKKIMPQ
jgi:hypothetical protein